MQYTKTADGYLLRLDADEEIVSKLTWFADDRRIDTGIVSGIGSVHHTVLGYFDRASKEYLRRTIETDCEIVSLQGNIALKEGKAFTNHDLLRAMLVASDNRVKPGDNVNFWLSPDKLHMFDPQSEAALVGGA